MTVLLTALTLLSICLFILALRSVRTITIRGVRKITDIDHILGFEEFSERIRDVVLESLTEKGLKEGVDYELEKVLHRHYCAYIVTHLRAIEHQKEKELKENRSKSEPVDNTDTYRMN